MSHALSVADPQALTPEEEALRGALLVDESESSEDGEAWSKHSTWQLPIFVKDAALMHVQVQTTTVQPLIVGLLKHKVWGGAATHSVFAAATQAGAHKDIDGGSARASRIVSF